MAEQVGNSPAGVIEKIPNLAYRTRARYWRNFGTAEKPDWRQTDPLPADIVGQAQYLSRGFRLDNPNEVKPAPVSIEQSKPDTEKQALYDEIAELRRQLAEAGVKRPKVKASESPGIGQPS